VGTTKLTRKEILGDDPVYDAIVTSIEGVRTHAKVIGLTAAAVALVGLGIYLGIEMLDKRDTEAQRTLARAIDFYHGGVDSGALDDPYGKGPDPVFRSEDAKYQAAAKEFSALIDRYGSSKLAVVGRYYLGLCRLRLGQRVEAIKAFEIARDNTKDRTVAYLAKKVLAKCQVEAGNPKAAQEILEGMVRDPQCELPKEELKLELARALKAQGKSEEALRILREARAESGRSSLQGLIAQEISRAGIGAGASSEGATANPGLPDPPTTVAPK